MTADPFTRVIDVLRHARTRPEMYVHPLDVGHAVSWLSGVAMYEVLFQDEIGRPHWLDLRQNAVESRGWAWESRGWWVEMQERGLTPRQIIDELLLIEIAVLEAARSVANSQPASEN